MLKREADAGKLCDKIGRAPWPATDYLYTGHVPENALPHLRRYSAATGDTLYTVHDADLYSADWECR